MRRCRSLAIVLMIIVLTLAVTSPARADGAKTYTGSSQGTATALPPTTGATCNPPAPTMPSDLICQFDDQGTFTLKPGVKGSYAGQTTVDYNVYTSAQPCGQVSGNLDFQGNGGTIQTTVDPTQSRVCETSDPAVHTTYLVLDITGGTGRFAGATGTIISTGTTTRRDSSSVYDEQADLSAMISRGSGH
jgi:hypothetical protein